MTKQKYTKQESTVVPMASVKLLQGSPEPPVDKEQPTEDVFL